MFPSGLVGKAVRLVVGTYKYYDSLFLRNFMLEDDLVLLD